MPGSALKEAKMAVGWKGVASRTGQIAEIRELGTMDDITRDEDIGVCGLERI
jgi:hypothetical protein